MTLQQMEYIVAVDKYRHFAKAAESCGISQSTLSSLVQKLEFELDVTIFDRKSHPIKPTTVGEEIISRAKLLLFNAAQVRELVATRKRRISRKSVAWHNFYCSALFIAKDAQIFVSQPS